MRTKDQAVAAHNYLTTTEVGEMLNVSRHHVAALVREGDIEAVDIGLGKRSEWRIHPDAVDSFLEARAKR